MISAAVVRSLRVPAIREARIGHARFEARQAERQLGEQQERQQKHHPRVLLCRKQVGPPVLDRARMLHQLNELPADHDHVHGEVQRDEQHGHPDRLAKAAHENAAEEAEQQ
jgi:hypothetical protein